MIGNLIGGKESSLGSVEFQTENPVLFTKNPEKFLEATLEETSTACRLANESFQKFQSTTLIERADLLRKIGKQINTNKARIQTAYLKESGLSKPRFEAEFTRTLTQIENFVQLLENNNFLLISKEGNLVKKNVGIGAIAIFGASNFPLAYSTMGGDSVSALAAGCPIVVKSHPMHALTSYEVAKSIVEAIEKTNFPKGIFAHLNAVGYEVGSAIVRNQHIKGVGFTGSIRGGMALQKIAWNRPEPIPVFAEMGSVNPVFVFPSKMDDELAEKIAHSMTNDGGQFCTNPNVIFIDKSQKSIEFKEKLIKIVNSTSVFTLLNSQIKNSFFAQREQQESLEVKALISSENNPTSNQVKHSVFETNLLHFLENGKLKEEVFGAHTLLVNCASTDDFETAMRSFSGQLTASIFATQEEIAQNENLLFQMQTKAGRVIFNDVPTGVQTTSSMHHGGPFPASTDARFTAVGTDSILRWLRPVCFQGR